MAKNLTAKQLIEAINEKKQPESINEYVNVLAEKIDEASKLPLFFKSPINIISSIVQKAVLYEENDPITLIKDIADKTSRVHEKESILLLNNFSVDNMPPLTIENIIDIDKQFQGSELLTKLGELQEKEICALDIDYDLEIEQLKQKLAQKKQVNNELRKKLKEAKNKFPPIKKKPKHFTPQIFKAIEQGELASVQYLLEVRRDYKEQKNFFGETPFYVACYFGELEIVEYLCVRQKINKEAANNNGWTPFFAACYMGNLDVVRYLCERQNINKEAANNNGWTPFYAACYNNKLNVVQYLCEKQNIRGNTGFCYPKGKVREYLQSIGVIPRLELI